MSDPAGEFRRARAAALRHTMESSIDHRLPLDGDVPWRRAPARTMRAVIAEVARKLLEEKNPFFDEICLRWGELMPGVPARPGRYGEGKLFLYVETAGTLFMLRGKLRAFKKVFAALPSAPKRFTVHLEIHKSAPFRPARGRGLGLG